MTERTRPSSCCALSRRWRALKATTQALAAL
jgi:hypothetical protein